MSANCENFNSFYKPIKCPKCQSKKIFHLRIDSDWGAGIGNYTPINDKKEYTEDELKYDSFDRPDLDLFHCLNCDYIWDIYNQAEVSE